MTPAERVIKLFGGTRQTAEALGISPTSGAVNRWKTPKSQDPRGLDGNIPMRHRDKILNISDERQWGLTYDDLRTV